jgi:lysophospholipid acyltransferase (LPLAT)-like uncharacterized protein
MRGWLVRILVAVIGSTLRYRIVDEAGLLANLPAAPVLVAFWHNRIFLMPHLFRKHWRTRRHARVAVLVSASKDGGLLAEVMAAFRLRCVRGSTSRRGREALRELVGLVRDGYDIGITPDGPRGPRYVLQPGVIQLAQLTGAAILPVSYSLSRKITFNSWDRFMVPLPFARCTVRIGRLVSLPRDADAALGESKRRELEQTLRELSGEPAVDPAAAPAR